MVSSASSPSSDTLLLLLLPARTRVSSSHPCFSATQQCEPSHFLSLHSFMWFCFCVQALWKAAVDKKDGEPLTPLALRFRFIVTTVRRSDHPVTISMR